MENINLKYALEAMLFASGEPLSINVMAQAVEISPQKAQKLLCELKDEYDYSQRGFRLFKMDNTYQMLSRNEYFDYIKKILQISPASFLSQAALETLAIVAYKQPVTRSDIEYIRGVQSSSSLDLLIDRGLVRASGKLELPGRPSGYETTSEFLKMLNISSLDELPSYEEFKNGVQLKFDETSSVLQIKEDDNGEKSDESIKQKGENNEVH